MPGDPRQADVAGAQGLVEAALRRGAVRLPDLSEAELCAVGAATQSLIDGDTWARWRSLSDTQRGLLTEMAQDLLVTRKLLVPPQPATGPAATGEIPARPELGIILTARARPTVIAVCHPDGPDHAHQPRMFGVAEQGTGLRVLVTEHLTTQRADPVRNVLGRVIEYFLLSPQQAGRTLASWAAEPARRGGLRRQRPARVVGIYRGRDADAGGLACERIGVRHVRGGLLLDHTGPDGPHPPVTCDKAELAQLLTGALIRMAA